MEIDELARWLADRWGSEIPARAAVPGAGLPDESVILDTIDCGLLAQPYVEVYRDGVRLSADAVSTARTVQNYSVAGFVHYRRVMAEFHQGATLRFPAVDDWLPGVRPLAEAARRALSGGVEANACLAAAGASVTVADRQRDLALLVCAGTIRLDAGGQEEKAVAGSGDVFYLPANTIRGAAAGDDGCLFITLSDRELTTAELVRSLHDAACSHLDKQPANERNHLMTVEQRADWVRGELTAFFASLEPGEFARLLVEPG
jgi:hypothetical protein